VRHAAKRLDLTNGEHVRLEQLEREDLELRLPNETLCPASTCFAKAERDRRAE